MERCKKGLLRWQRVVKNVQVNELKKKKKSIGEVARLGSRPKFCRIFAHISFWSQMFSFFSSRGDREKTNWINRSRVLQQELHSLLEQEEI
jgi:hypothetical protein